MLHHAATVDVSLPKPSWLLRVLLWLNKNALNNYDIISGILAVSLASIFQLTLLQFVPVMLVAVGLGYFLGRKRVSLVDEFSERTNKLLEEAASNAVNSIRERLQQLHEDSLAAAQLLAVDDKVWFATTFQRSKAKNCVSIDGGVVEFSYTRADGNPDTGKVAAARLTKTPTPLPQEQAEASDLDEADAVPASNGTIQHQSV